MFLSYVLFGSIFIHFLQSFQPVTELKPANLSFWFMYISSVLLGLFLQNSRVLGFFKGFHRN